MTFGELRDITSMLVLGDFTVPAEDVRLIPLLKLAYTEIADMATPLKWLTLNKDVAILRQGVGDYFVRMPSLPVDPTDELDIDSELVPVVARMFASYLAKDIQVKMYHRQLAEDMLKKYDAKVRGYMNNKDCNREYDYAE
jgi:hypothetical protein